jgi:hypothetical protein
LWNSHIKGYDMLRAQGVLQAWRAGLWDARWFPGFDFGYGYPFLSFYAPLFHWLTAAWTWLLPESPTLAFRANLAMWLILGTAGMYHAGKALWSQLAGGRVNARYPALLCAAAWLMSPYLICDIYVRGDGPEFASAQMMPWIIWGAVHLLLGREAVARRDYCRGLVLALALSVAILTHNIYAMLAFGLAAVLLPGMMVLRWYEQGIGWRRGFFARRAAIYVGAMGAALLLTAFFWLPVQREMRFVQVDPVRQNKLHYSYHFATLDRSYDFGYWSFGGSRVRPDNPLARLMPVHLGWSGLAGAVSAVVAGSWLVLKCRRERRFLGAIMLLLLGGGLGYVMVFRISTPIWEIAGPLQFAQFPWRLLILPTLSLCLLLPSAPVMGNIGLTRRSTRMAWASAMVLLVGLCCVASFSTYVRARPGSLPAELDTSIWPNTRILTAHQDEYASIWRPRFRPKSLEAGTVLADASVQIQKALPRGIGTKIWLTNSGDAPAAVTIAYAYFPGWSATLDQTAKPLEISPSEQGFIRVSQVPPGEHIIRLSFGDTPVRRFSKIISGMAWLAWLAAWPALWLAGQRAQAAAQERQVPELVSNLERPL